MGNQAYENTNWNGFRAIESKKQATARDITRETKKIQRDRETEVVSHKEISGGIQDGACKISYTVQRIIEEAMLQVFNSNIKVDRDIRGMLQFNKQGKHTRTEEVDKRCKEGVQR